MHVPGLRRAGGARGGSRCRSRATQREEHVGASFTGHIGAEAYGAFDTQAQRGVSRRCRSVPTEMSARLTTGQALVRFLAAQWSERDGTRQRLVPALLGIFGHGNVAGLGEALLHAGDDLPFVQGRNEQSLVHVAAAFARERRRLATLAVTASIGPGSTNMVTGASLATVNRLPVLLLPSDVYASRRQGNVLQQLEHPVSRDVSVNDCFRPVARFFDRVSRPEQLLDVLPEAMRVLTDPVETGAVVVALPQDVQSEAGEFPERFFAEHVWQVERPRPDPLRVDGLASLIAGARRPLVVAGGGVFYSAAEEALEELSAALGIPVAETFAGKGVVSHRSWRALGGIGVEGNPAANAVAREADLVLFVGTRLGDFTTASRSLFASPEVRFGAINVTGRDAAKLGALPVVADAREALRALLEIARAKGVSPSPSWEGWVTERTERWSRQRAAALADHRGAQMTSGEVIGTLNERASEGDLVLTAAGSPPGDLLKVWDSTGGRRCHLEFGFSCMGYELPGGLGARLARRDGEVVVLVGDGSFVMAPGELATAVQEGLKLTIVVLDNHGFQVIRRLQVARVGTSFGNEFRLRASPLRLGEEPAGLSGDFLPIDVVQIARGLGAGAAHARTLAELVVALDEARQASGPFVVVADVDPYRDLPSSEAWWDVAPAETSVDDTTQELRKEYEAARASQRFYG